MIISVFFTVKIPKLFKKAKVVEVPKEPTKAELCRRNTGIVIVYLRSNDEEERQKLKELNQELFEKLI